MNLTGMSTPKNQSNLAVCYFFNKGLLDGQHPASLV